MILYDQENTVTYQLFIRVVEQEESYQSTTDIEIEVEQDSVEEEETTEDIQENNKEVDDVDVQNSIQQQLIDWKDTLIELQNQKIANADD